MGPADAATTDLPAVQPQGGSFVVGDSANIEMPYTQEAAIKSHGKRLRQFVKLIDYIFVDAKANMVTQSTHHLANKVRYYNRLYSDEKALAFNNNPSWLIVEVNEQVKKNKFLFI